MQILYFDAVPGTTQTEFDQLKHAADQMEAGDTSISRASLLRWRVWSSNAITTNPVIIQSHRGIPTLSNAVQTRNPSLTSKPNPSM